MTKPQNQALQNKPKHEIRQELQQLLQHADAKKEQAQHNSSHQETDTQDVAQSSVHPDTTDPLAPSLRKKITANQTKSSKHINHNLSPDTLCDSVETAISKANAALNPSKILSDDQLFKAVEELQKDVNKMVEKRAAKKGNLTRQEPEQQKSTNKEENTTSRRNKRTRHETKEEEPEMQTRKRKMTTHDNHPSTENEKPQNNIDSKTVRPFIGVNPLDMTR